MVKLNGKCKKCFLVKNLTDFYLKKSTRKHDSTCKKCRNDFAKVRYKSLSKKDKEKYSLRVKNWATNNTVRRKNIINRYHKKHSEKEKLYYLANSENIKTRNRKWLSLNKTRANERLRRYRRRPEVKLRNNVSSLIRFHIKKNDGAKNNCSILDFLNYSITDLMKHLSSKFEPWMNWNNHGNFNLKTWDDKNNLTWTWQIDHIIPQSQLPYRSMTDDNFKKCWDLENLRPFSSKQNVLNGTKLQKRRRKK